jgi:lysyl-tRNA synthetase, class II
MDLGDFVGIEGFVFKTRTEEITVHAKKLQVLSKSLRPPPLGKQKGDEHWYGLQDVELKYRKRHLDLMTNPESLEVFEKRSRIIAAIRDFFNARGYLEVETPVLQEQAGGAAARPFMTHHNALDHDFKLRISLELYLKRLIIGGFDKVYELGRVFRNEGLSTRHNPEFTLLESYEAYADLDDIMSLVEELFCTLPLRPIRWNEVCLPGPGDKCAPPWRRLPLLEGIELYAGVKREEFDTLGDREGGGERLGLSMDEEHLVGGIIEKIHERFTQPHLISRRL